MGMEDGFLHVLRALRPRQEYVRLFREIVLDVWKQKQDEARLACDVLQRQITDIEARRQRLLAAHVYNGTIAEDVYGTGRAERSDPLHRSSERSQAANAAAASQPRVVNS